MGQVLSSTFVLAILYVENFLWLLSASLADCFLSKYSRSLFSGEEHASSEGVLITFTSFELIGLLTFVVIDGGFSAPFTFKNIIGTAPLSIPRSVFLKVSHPLSREITFSCSQVQGEQFALIVKIHINVAGNLVFSSDHYHSDTETNSARWSPSPNFSPTAQSRARSASASILCVVNYVPLSDGYRYEWGMDPERFQRVTSIVRVPFHVRAIRLPKQFLVACFLL